MFFVVYREKELWFAEPIQAEEISPAQGWEVEEFNTIAEAEEFIVENGLHVASTDQ